MIISDLNHLEVVNQETNVVGAGSWGYGSIKGSSDINVDIYKDVDIDVYEDVDIYKDFDVDAHVKGVSAFAEAEALAYGKNNHSEALTFTLTKPGLSTASGQSLSITG